MTNPSPPTPNPNGGDEQPNINELMRAIAAQQLANSEQIAKNAEGISELRAATAANQTAIAELKATVAETSAKVDQLTNAVNAMMPVIQSHSQRFELQQATLQTMMAQLLKHDVQIKQIEAA
ncbi:MAG: hypothetical protein AAFO06_04570 [Cyanobacteria bacterium J06597_16]